MAVVKWPSYLLRGIPADTLQAMTERADQDDMSLADVVRQAVCHRYRMDCDHFSVGYQPSGGADTLLVRLQPEVWKKMKRDTTSPDTGRSRYGAMRNLILDSLNVYLEVRSDSSINPTAGS